ncbi:MAG TPA: protein kinase [Pyrinomonadaceae bacterium]|jgi:Serine/threonine protein kinase|nr:protein kinase [Pyrinomonadaceae bacterium]
MKYCTACKEKYEDSVSFCPVDGEVLEDDPAFIVGTVLDGQYQMEALLGKGGMGAVYRARHILLGDRVAIKVLPPEVRTNAEWLRRFRREGQAARRFRHPNAVTVYDLRTAADGTIYMVMEYVEGHTLDAELKKRGRFSAPDAFETLTPIMSVLDTAHSMGVVHRDLKPENIMIGSPSGNGGPTVKLLDLGIAKMREIAGVDSSGNTALTMAGQVLGTPYYMSPEQWGEISRDQNIEIDGRADIYSLGLVFYELIAGRRCYSGTTLSELRREHVATVAKPLHEVVPSVPRGFSDAIQRATAKDRSDRQPTASVLAAELKAGLTTASSGIQPLPNLAETISSSGPIQTNSDVNAPTVIGLDASITSVPGSAPDTSAPSPVVSSPAPANTPAEVSLSGPTMVEHAHAESSVTIPQAPRPLVTDAAAPSASKSKAGLLVGLVVLAIIGVAIVVGGFLIYTKLKPSPSSTTTNIAAKPPANTAVEAGRYWLMLEPASSKEAPTRVAGLVPLASGQAFQVRFIFPENGYVYIVGPGGDNNEPAAFLTNKPAPETGLTSNEARGGSEFSFPSGDGLLRLDAKPGTDKFTVIFSRTKLESPQFLSTKAVGKPLPPDQLKEFDDFIGKNMQKAPSTELDDSNNQLPYVRVKVDADHLGTPIVFEIRIQHN